MTTAQVCSNSQCKVATEGKCVEGLSLDLCPYFGKTALPDEPSAVKPPIPTKPPGLAEKNTATKQSEKKSDSLALNSGDFLSVESATSVMVKNLTKVFAVIGPAGAGKTSLIASLYQIFLKGPTATYSFARSKTLIAFERACHDTRYSSLQVHPKIPRTPHITLTAGVAFYHLGISEKNSERLIDNLIADRTGEEYTSAQSDCSLFAKYPEIKRADAISILLDGERLISRQLRHNVIGDIEMMLQALMDSEILNESQRIFVVLTKFDLMKQQSDCDVYLAEFDELVSTLKARFSKLDITPHIIAALPDSAVVEYAYGVSELLYLWINQPLKQSEWRSRIETNPSSRLIDRFNHGGPRNHE